MRHEWLTVCPLWKLLDTYYLNQPPFGEVNDLNLFLFEFQSSLLLAAVSTVPILGVPFLLSAVITGSMKIHPTEVVLAYNLYNM